MKKFSCISDEQLHELTLKSSQNEKSATLVLLEHLAEVDARRLYAIMGYSSLWEYTHQALNYSESQASERVSAMRLIVKVPEVKNELKNGNLTLTSTAKLASHVRREKTSSNDTLILLNEIAGKASREVEKILASESTSPAKPDQVKIITQDLTRITIEVDEEFLILMNRMKELKGHSGSTPQELFKAAMQTVIKKDDEKLSKTEKAILIEDQGIRKLNQRSHSSLRAPEVKLTKWVNANQVSHVSSNRKNVDGYRASRYISQKIKLAIRLRSKDQCEYVSSDGRRCQSKTNLEFDHHLPFAKGGQNNVENLRHYCASHNRLWAIQSYGAQTMGKFMRMS